MQRFFLTPEHFSGLQVTFPRETAHQIIHVLRLNEGDQVDVLDNSGVVHRVRLHVKAFEMTVTGTIFETSLVSTEPEIPISLYFGLSRRDKVEWILQKGTEIGVSAFFPFISTRTLVKSASLSEKKNDRWVKIIQEAAEQSARGRLPALHAPKDFADCISEAKTKHTLSLLAWEVTKLGSDSLGVVLKSFDVGPIALFVGPEGGFSEDEVHMAQEMGCKIVSLGPRILRMETAAIVFPALVLFQLGEF